MEGSVTYPADLVRLGSYRSPFAHTFHILSRLWFHPGVLHGQCSRRPITQLESTLMKPRVIGMKAE